MELVKVRIEYSDQNCLDEHGLTPRKTVETWAAVHGSWGASIITEAGCVAIRGVIGDVLMDPEKLEKWAPVVMAAEYVGSVHVQGTQR